MPDVTIASQVTEFEWSGGTPPRLRVFAKLPFIAAGSPGIPVHAGNQYAGRAYLDEACTLDGSGRVVTPEITLPSTTDSPDRPDAEYAAFLYSRGADLASQYQEFSVFASGFRLDHRLPATTWELIATGIVPDNAEVIDWLEAVTDAGGSLSPTVISAADDLMEDLELVGLTDKLLRLNLFAGNDLNSALVPIIGTGADVNHNFVSGDYSLAGGLNAGPSNSTKYLDTGLSPSDAGLTLSDASLGIYALADENGVTSRAIGCAVDGSSEFAIFPCVGVGSGTILFAAFDESGNGRVEKGNVYTAKGFTVGSRVATNDARAFRDGQQIGSVTTAVPTSDPPDLNIFVFGYNLAGSPAALWSSSLGAYFIGFGLTTDDVANLDLILKTFFDAIGRAY